MSRRAAILDAALEVFADSGVAAASIDDIRTRSGASVGSIYHRFGSKEGIATALWVDSMSGYQDGFLAALQRSASAREGVEAVVRHHLAWVAANPARARFLLAERPAGSKELRALNRRFFPRVKRWLAARVESGELRDLHSDVVYALWIGPSQELARHWLAGRTRIDLDEAAAALAAAAWQALANEEAQ